MGPSPTFCVALCLGMLALSYAAREVRWCVKSEAEYKKCQVLVNTCKHPDITLTCERRSNVDECLVAIEKESADAICLDGGDVYRASLKPHNLKPIMAENYGTEDDAKTRYLAIAVAKKSSKFMFKDLEKKRTCHTGVGRTAGWNMPIGTLIERGLLKWGGPEKESIEKAVSKFVSAACAPGAKESNLCRQCVGEGKKKCSLSNDEPYSDYDGALRCLMDGKGDVAFVKDATVAGLDPKEYELICPDDTRKPVTDAEVCNFAQAPAHAVVTRSSGDKREDIIEFLVAAQKKKECKLFESNFGKNLIFKDSAMGLIETPKSIDAFLYIGAKYFNAMTALRQEPRASVEGKVRFCTQSILENKKCDEWSLVSGGAIECIEATGSGSRAEECIRMILEGDADAVTLDGGFLYTAGRCGLVPVFGEYYNKDDLTPCKTNTIGKKQGSYFAVAVVKTANKGINWKNLKGKKSCHTGVGRTAGWNVVVGRIANETNNCDMGKFFSQSCAPGADVKSNLCALCVGDNNKLTESKYKCASNDKEGYNAYSGALRCLVEAGDVCFVKHTTVFQNTNGNNPAAWAKGLKESDFQLLCLDGTRAPVDQYKKCNLAEVPAHAVITRPDKRDAVFNVIANQQENFGRKGFQKDMFQMFVSSEGSDLLFKDSTQCLLGVEKGTTMEAFLGVDYDSAVTHLIKCTGKSDLLAACTFHNH
ncbi:serotransferrin [Discoglossus pictus]